ncbi:DUF4292 domain-containing protein [Leeuwenhoekiella sp. MAR_2009_132]|uniref:DUF4292 domain-containing protein n=1 Tax=Leeuwenhoekiella sp. MAR_2009_132 TaxID=1392489 RepID=UPI000491B996|nr:DUF4292 domain-containing protein [Leeuwenhoekiella sp. MAR_2009_132]
MRIYFKSFVVLLMVSLTACKSTKKVAATNDDLASAKIIASHYETHPQFETLAARLKIKYSDPDRTQSVTVSLRMQKDETIWMSASVLGISLAKAMITKDRVQFYEKIDGTYFDGDFKLLSDLLGTELNYEQVEALLLGEPIYDLRNGGFSAGATGTRYLVAPRQQQNLFNLFFYLNAGAFTLQEQRLTQSKEQRDLTIKYADYIKEQNGYFPTAISISAQEENKETLVDIEYKGVDFNTEVSFPFSIPGGLKEIKL